MSNNDTHTSGKLALHGGPKAVTTPLPPWPAFDDNAIRAVEQVLRPGKVEYWTGPHGMEFEKQFAAWQGSRYAVSVRTGTPRLPRQAGGAEAWAGDEVILPITRHRLQLLLVQAGAIPRSPT